MQRMMRAAERTITHPGTDAYQHRRHIRIANVVLDLFQRAGGKEARRRNTERFFATRSKARGDANEILLGNPYFNNLFGERFSKRREFTRATRVAGYGEDVWICFGQFFNVAANTSRLVRPILRPSFSAIAVAAGVNIEGVGALI